MLGRTETFGSGSPRSVVKRMATRATNDGDRTTDAMMLRHHECIVSDA